MCTSNLFIKIKIFLCFFRDFIFNQIRIIFCTAYISDAIKYFGILLKIDTESIDATLFYCNSMKFIPFVILTMNNAKNYKLNPAVFFIFSIFFQ